LFEVDLQFVSCLDFGLVKSELNFQQEFLSEQSSALLTVNKMCFICM